MIIPGAAQQQNRDKHHVSAIVKVDGKDVTAKPGGLVSLSIYQEINKVPTACLIFADGSVGRQEFSKSNSSDFTPGKTLEILLGYKQEEETIFKGIISRHSVRILAGRPFYLEIECKDPVVRATLVRHSRYYYSEKDSAIIEQILGAYEGVSMGEVEDTTVKHPELVQYHCTDWDFAILRADANGKYVNAKDGKVTLQTPNIKSKADVQIKFGEAGAGHKLIEFESDIDVQTHYPAVKAYAWDYTQQKIVEETAGSTAGSGITGSGLANQVGSILPGGPPAREFPQVLYGQEAVRLQHGGDLDTRELNSWVAAKHKRGELSRVRGRVKIKGEQVYPGDTIEIKGVGDRFNGTHLVTAVLQQVFGGTWETDIQFGWSSDFFAEKIQTEQPDASGLTSAIQGLQVGVVSKIAGDEREGNHRIQVRLPYVAQGPNGSQAEGIWARLATLYAGESRGFVFRPEINDEVILGFINNDPNDAVILGALHSNKHPAPEGIEATDENKIKGFIGREGLQILFDEENQSILLKTGEGDNVPTIELKGKEGKIVIKVDSTNAIELNASGIDIDGARIDLN